MVIEGAAAQPQVRDDERDAAALASLMDPAALERRLAQAREQRAAALAARKAAGAAGPPYPAPPGKAPRRPAPLPPLAGGQAVEIVSPSESTRPAPSMPAVVPVPPPTPLPPLVAERRLPPPTRRRVLPAGVLIGFAAGAVAALGAVVVLDPRIDLPTSLGAAPAAPPPEAGPAAPVAFAEIVAVPAQAPAGPPARTLAETPPAIDATPPAALRTAAQAMTATRPAPQRAPEPERLALARSTGPAPLAPAAGGDTPPSELRGAAAPPAVPAEAIPAPAEAPVLAEAGAPTGDDAPAVPFPDRDLRLIVHAPSGVPGAEVDAALTLLAGAVAPPEGPIRVNFAIGSSNVRYYHAADAEAAMTAAASLSNRLGPVEARDFTGYQPSPAPGTIEVWLSGIPGAPARSAPRASAAPEVYRQAPERTVSGREPQAVVHGIPNLVQSVVQNRANQAADAARAAARAREAERRRDGGIGNALRRAYGAP